MAEKVTIGNTTLYCADCMDILPTLGKVDAVITDPPYSETTHKNAKSNRAKGYGNKAIDFSSITDGELSIVIADLGLICDRWLVSTMEWRHIAKFDQAPPDGWELVRFGVWVKTNPMPQISCDRPSQGWEGIAYLHKKGEKKQWNGGGRHGNYVGALVTDGGHPTGKPVLMFSQFVERFSNSDETILDPFMGSGTTGVAAVQMGRKFIGIEKDPRYFEIACKRIQAVYDQPDMFVQREKPAPIQDELI